MKRSDVMSDSKSDPQQEVSGTTRAGPDRIERFVTRLKQLAWIVGSLWVLVVICMSLQGRILVEPVAVPKNLADQGMSEAVAQQQLTADLIKLKDDASKTMPHQIKDEIEADGPEANIELESTGISLQAFIQYTQRMLGFHDVLVRAALVMTDDGLYTLKATIDNSETVVIDSAQHSSDPAKAIDAGSDKIMEAHNPFIYASALAVRERDDCYKDDTKCSYADAIQAFNDLLKDDANRHYYKWSWLALSKIDEDKTNYRDEVTKAMLSIKDDPTFALGYYNWGIGLAEQGCGKEALEAFETAVLYKPTLDYGYNAAGRAALDLALKEDPVTDAKARKEHLDRALDYLMTATSLNGNYGEAYVNLGEAMLALDDPDELDDARGQFVSALLGESSQVQRAYVALTEHGLALPKYLAEGPSPKTIEALEDVHVESEKCGNERLATSVRRANGCLSSGEKEIAHATGIKPFGTLRYIAASIPDDYCRNASVKENVGKLQPYLLNPVYGSRPVTRGESGMSGP